MREEFRGIACALIHRILAAHLDVAAERNGADTVVCVAFSESQKAFPEANREHFDPNSKQFGGGIVSEFMNQDHEPQDRTDSDDSSKKVRHRFSKSLGKSR